MGERIYISKVAAWSPVEQEDGGEHIDRALTCLACGRELQAPLARGGSLRCLDCRDVNAPLDPALVREWQASDAQF